MDHRWRFVVAAAGLLVLVAAWGLSEWSPLSRPTVAPVAVPERPVGCQPVLPRSLLTLPAAGIDRYARACLDAGDYDQALLAFKQAAERGYGAAAYAIGAMYDPLTFTQTAPASAFSAPNPGKALDWYEQALSGGVVAAKAALLRLRTQLEQQAAAGDDSAQRLLQKR